MNNGLISTSVAASGMSRLQKMAESDSEKISRLEKENDQLKIDIAIERQCRYTAEQEIKRLNEQILTITNKTTAKKQKKSKELSATEYSEYNSNGIRKARAADSIRSYEDFKLIQDYFWSRNRVRDWALWTVGVSLGLRVSDLLNLKIQDVLNKDGAFKNRIHVIEIKTHKANNCLITESVSYALKTYFDDIKWNFVPSDYVFRSRKTKGKMYEEYGWKILSDAGKELNLPIVVGSHTMRKSFANIAACVDKANIDMNSITKIQGLLNHSEQKVTMRYLGTYQKMFDRARIAVSDFVLGKTNVHELVAGTDIGLNDIAAKLEELEALLQKDS